MTSITEFSGPDALASVPAAPQPSMLYRAPMPPQAEALAAGLGMLQKALEKDEAVRPAIMTREEVEERLAKLDAMKTTYDALVGVYLAISLAEGWLTTLRSNEAELKRQLEQQAKEVR